MIYPKRLDRLNNCPYKLNKLRNDLQIFINILFDVSQKLDVLFRLRLVDEFSGKRYYLQDDQEIMPLFTQAVER